MKAIISLAARVRSTRLPRKVLAEVQGKPLLQLIVERLARSKAEVVISNNENDPEIDDLAFRMGVQYVRGNGCDMMTMHWLAANKTDADLILLAGADDPFLDPAIFDLVLDHLLSDDVSFAKTSGWPLGLNAWGWTRAAMEDGRRVATAPEERQHVVPFWERRSLAYPAAVIRRPGPDLYDRFRCTIDEQADLNMARLVYDGLDGQITADAVIAFLERHPEIAAVNAKGLHGYAARDAIYSLDPVDSGTLATVRRHVATERAAALAAARENSADWNYGRAAALLSLDQWLRYQERIQ